MIDSNISGIITINGKKIKVKCDLALKHEDCIELIKISASNPKLSYKARVEDNKPENNFELYLMYLLGKKEFNGYNLPIKSSFYHLKGKCDEGDNYKLFLEEGSDSLLKIIQHLEESKALCKNKRETNKVDTQIRKIQGILHFDYTEGDNIIGCDKFNSEYIEENLIDLLDKELSINSPKCKKSHCSECQERILCQLKESEGVKLEPIEKPKNIKKEEIKLVDAQKNVVYFNKGIRRVNSCCGTGKTFTNTLRLNQLLKYNKPKDILMITFTNKGVEELKNKVDKLTSVNKKRLNIFTFNSFGSRIIDKEYLKMGFKEPPELIDKIEKVDMIINILALDKFKDIKWLNYRNPLMNFPDAKGCVYELIGYFNKIKSFGVQYLSLEPEKINDVLDMYNEFNSRLKEANKIEYQDQLLLTVKLFEDYPKLIQKYGYRHIMVDEFQDTDKIQIKLLKLLQQYKDFESLMVTGDTSQSIYEFRNTTPENMLNFHKEFEGTEDIFLLENFRSYHEICDLANKLDRLNENRIDKTMVSTRGVGGIVKLKEYPTLEDEYEDFVEIIKQNKPEDVCIIARQSKELLDIQQVLNNFNVPNKLDVPELYMKNPNIITAINLTKFLQNTDNDFYLMEYLMNINEDLQNNEEIKSLLEIEKENITKQLEIEDADYTATYLDMISKITEKDDVCKVFFDNILESKKFANFNDLASYLQKFILYNDNSQIDKDAEIKYKAVTLTTAHSSKGKEWPIVVNTIDKYKYNESERRLLFVSITRAKDELYITYHNKKGKYCKFVDELKEIMK